MYIISPAHNDNCTVFIPSLALKKQLITSIKQAMHSWPMKRLLLRLYFVLVIIEEVTLSNHPALIEAPPISLLFIRVPQC